MNKFFSTKGLFLFLLALSLFYSGCSSPTRKTSSVAHFISEDGNDFPEYEQTWEKLKSFYGTAMPKQVMIVFTDAGDSRFDPKHNSIALDRKKFKEDAELLITHETSHLCLALLTNGASINEKFRFMDEGFAKIISKRIAGNLDLYKNDDSLPEAAIQLMKKNVSFVKVQKWSEYFGGPSAGRWYAYDVGASFDFFIMDRYGEETLIKLFMSIGKTFDLDGSLKQVINKSTKEIESDWIEYLSKIQNIDGSPQIVEFIPANNSQDVSTDISEVLVRFNVPMNQRDIIIIGDCNGGICYKNAYWKSSRTLAIKLPEKLKNGVLYKAQFGKKDNPFLSKIGVSLPITDWQFKTQ